MVDGQGAVLARVQGGPGNYQLLGADALASLIGDLLLQAAPAAKPLALCAAVAGAGREPEQRALRQRLEHLQLADRCVVTSDARAALEGAHGGRAGIVCIAGTGSMVLGRDGSGAQARAGGWGPILGDEGSAYWLVIESLRRVLQAEDGCGMQTQLRDQLLPALNLQSPQDVVGAVYGGSLSRERISEACPVVFDAARSGDQAAMDVIRSGGMRLGSQIAAVAGRLSLAAPVPVACSGGVFAELDALRQHVQAGAGGCELVLGPPRLPASLGAVLMALAAGGVQLPQVVVDSWVEASG